MDIWFIWLLFGKFSPVLVRIIEKNLATLHSIPNTLELKSCKHIFKCLGTNLNPLPGVDLMKSVVGLHITVCILYNIIQKNLITCNTLCTYVHNRQLSIHNRKVVSRCNNGILNVPTKRKQCKKSCVNA
jgi:hypothetical protein